MLTKNLMTTGESPPSYRFSPVYYKCMYFYTRIEYSKRSSFILTSCFSGLWMTSIITVSATIFFSSHYLQRCIHARCIHIISGISHHQFPVGLEVY